VTPTPPEFNIYVRGANEERVKVGVELSRGRCCYSLSSAVALLLLLWKVTSKGECKLADSERTSAGICSRAPSATDEPHVQPADKSALCFPRAGSPGSPPVPHHRPQEQGLREQSARPSTAGAQRRGWQRDAEVLIKAEDGERLPVTSDDRRPTAPDSVQPHANPPNSKVYKPREDPSTSHRCSAG
jgi:hypothetical protein